MQKIAKRTSKRSGTAYVAVIKKIVELKLQNTSNRVLLQKITISFFKRSSFKLTCETVIGIVLWYSHQACIHIYQITFFLIFTLLFLDVVTVSDLNEIMGRLMDLVKKKKAHNRRFAYPYSPAFLLV